MATPLEIKKIKAELLRVQSAKADFEVRIEDHMENIARLNAQMTISQAKEDELTKTLADIQNA
jgi:septal ring factor EnvC (AmiA/AmiB activator)